MASTKTSAVATANFIGGSIREDLANFITQLSPESTPFLSSIGSSKAKQPRHDWQTDILATPDNTNIQAEDFDFDTANASNDVPVRLSNYTEVTGKTIHVAGSLIKSDFAGAQDYFSYQRMKRGKEIMRDIEAKRLTWNNVTGASGANTKLQTYDNASATRRSAGVYAYAGNWSNVAATSMSAYTRAGVATAIASSAGTATAATGFNTRETDGTKAVHYTAAPTNKAVEADHINTLAEQFSLNNGMMTVMQVPTRLKSSISNALIAGNGGAAQRRADEMAKKVNLAVDSVLTEFGFDLSIVPNYIMDQHAGASNIALAYDPKAIKRVVLTPMTTEEDGTARYGKGYIMYCDESLEVADPNSVGVVAGLQ